MGGPQYNGRSLHTRRVEGVVEQFKSHGANDDQARSMADIYSRIGQPDSYPDAAPRTDATTTLHAFAEATLRPIIAG